MRELPGELAREMRADDDRGLVLRSTASEVVSRGNTRVRVELAHVKGLLATLAEATADSVRCRPPVGNSMVKPQLLVKQNALRCHSIQVMTRPARPV